MTEIKIIVTLVVLLAAIVMALWVMERRDEANFYRCVDGGGNVQECFDGMIFH